MGMICSASSVHPVLVGSTREGSTGRGTTFFESLIAAESKPGMPVAGNDLHLAFSYVARIVDQSNVHGRGCDEFPAETRGGERAEKDGGN